MKPKATNSIANSVSTKADLKALQTQMAEALFLPLTANYRMQKIARDGRDLRTLAKGFIKPNDRLNSFERLEIYARCYWFRLLDCLYDDYPGLRAVVGERKFQKLAIAYLEKLPSESFTLRNLGSRLEAFLRAEPHHSSPREVMALDMVRFEWAQIVAFDDPSLTTISPKVIAKTPPEKLRFSLQPYLTLLQLDHAVDDFFIAVKNRDAHALRSEASNTPDAAPEVELNKKRIPPPKKERVRLVVHRLDNQLYYKRLDAPAFALLSALDAGRSLAEACGEAVAATPDFTQDWPTQIQHWFHTWTQLRWLCPRKDRG